LCERRRGRRRGAREGACTGAATMPQPSTLRLILNAAALAAWGRTLCVCLLLQYPLQSCSRVWGGNNGGHVLRETTSRGLCELVCPSRTSERGGEGYCVKEGGGEEGESERERARKVRLHSNITICYKYSGRSWRWGGKGSAGRGCLAGTSTFASTVGKSQQDNGR